MERVFLFLLLVLAFYACKKTNEDQGTVKVTILSPANGSTIGAAPDLQFSWSVSPALSAGSPTGTFKIKIVEVIGDKSPEVALRSNKPHFEKDSLKELSFKYPITASRFAPGNKYSWGVTANKTSTTKESESLPSLFTAPK